MVSKSAVRSDKLVRVATAMLELRPVNRHFSSIHKKSGVESHLDVADVLYQLRMEGFIRRVRSGSVEGYLYVVVDEDGLRALIR